MHNGLVTDLSDYIKDNIIERVKKTEEIIVGIDNKKTEQYLDVLLNLKYDYEQLSEFEKASAVATECLALLYDGVGNQDMLGKRILSCYDTKARCGDFESFLLALEWNRPLEKQFYIPRRRILKKFGLIQAFQDVADGKLDFLCVNMPP